MNSQYNSMYDNRAIIETIGTERPYEASRERDEQSLSLRQLSETDGIRVSEW